MAGANVKVTNIRTGRLISADRSAGQYEVPGLPAGPYRVEASHPGLRPGIVSGIVLNATDTPWCRRHVECGLRFGASDGNCRNDDREHANQRDRRHHRLQGSPNLPLNGRDFTTLIALVPGSVTTGGFGQNSLGGYETTFAGVNVLLDGADATRID